MRSIKKEYEQTGQQKSRRQLFLAGLVMAFAIALHNFPEGMVIGASYASDVVSGGIGSLAIAIVIGLHNVPEGMSVAVPLAAGGMKKVRATLITAVTGAPTILGAIVGYLLGALSPVWLAVSLSFASGAMLYVVFGELLPESILMWRSKAPAFAMLRIRGVCRHEDHPHFGCALPYSAIAYDLMLLRSLGANSVRTAHYPNDEVFLDLCDEAGILVWEENHARGLSLEQVQNPHFEEQAEQVIREMVAQHFNHPSIYIWGILNECASDTPYGKACYEKQFSLLRALDPSRPCSFASCKFKTDLCFGLPDVVSYNIYPLWYHDTPPDEYLRDLYDWVQRETDGAGKPFLVSEIGAGGIYGQRSSYAAKWSEEYQAQALRRQLEGVLSHPGCSGVYVWQLTDIRVSEEWWGVRSRTMNNKGVFDEFRRPKLCFEVVRQLFSEDARRKSF